jgi:hypothetical protein
MLETVSFATDKCVPTQEETCHSGQPGNCEVDGTTVECKYARGAGSYLMKNELSPGFNCVDYERICVGTGENPSCYQGACIRYSPPACVQTCKQCALETLTRDEPIKGCKKFCAEESCADEPRCDPDPCRPGEPCNQNQVCAIKSIADPAGGNPFILPTAMRPECQSSTPCPLTATPPAYVTPVNCPSCQFNADGTVNVSVSGDTTCVPEPIEQDNTPVQNRSCPWISYERRQPACGDVTPGNRFPQDCTECNPPGTPNTKNCNIPVSRCN